ncbi:hypothetical protein LWE61_06435 [Sphingobium sufflavum]|uniref:anti-sigma factor n=1 Tax=Sphingobium sufflavum TaxID=1129547 RepID=UPI001F34ABF5|nr:hypothetical protein [Sphingobium sufflavum]MCE7796199.1 hypothetical protein [Sphingobium sufflavum]
MTIDRDTLAAYAEGQLDEADRARVEAAMAADPALAEDVARHRALRARLQARFAPVLDMPVPDRLLDAVRAPVATAQVVDLNAVRVARAETVSRAAPARRITGWITGGAIAASLAIGLILGGQIPGGGPVGTVGGRLVAQGALDTALTTQLASADPQPVQILLSLRNGEGRYCRVFQTDGLSGLACRDEGRWAVERLQNSGAATGGQYRQAGSAIGEIMAAAQAMAPDGALDRQREQIALEMGWR